MAWPIVNVTSNCWRCCSPVLPANEATTVYVPAVDRGSPTRRTTGRRTDIIRESQADALPGVEPGVPLDGAALSVAGNELPLYVPPASLTVTVGRGLADRERRRIAGAAVVLAARE